MNAYLCVNNLLNKFSIFIHDEMPSRWELNAYFDDVRLHLYGCDT
jgi:hypothetical protein